MTIGLNDSGSEMPTISGLYYVLRQRLSTLAGPGVRITGHKDYDVYSDGQKYLFVLLSHGGEARFRFSSREYFTADGPEEFTRRAREAISAITPSNEAVGL